MVNLLILNYVDHHSQAPQQVGYLSGNKTYQTYLLQVAFDRANKRDYNRFKDEIKYYFDQNKVDSVFEFDQEGINYLVDLNHEKHHKLKTFL